MPHEKPAKHWPIECSAGSLHPDELSEFFLELCSQMSKRIDYNDLTLENLKCLSPNVALSGDVDTLVPLLQRFPNLLGDTEAQRDKMQIKMQ